MCFRLFLIHLQSKCQATLGKVSGSKTKGSVTPEKTVWRKRRQKQNYNCQPCKKSLKVEARPTAMQKMLKQHLR